MLVVFPPIFVVDTKIIYGHNFVASLIENSFHIFSESILLLISNFKRIGRILNKCRLYRHLGYIVLDDGWSQCML